MKRGYFWADMNLSEAIDELGESNDPHLLQLRKWLIEANAFRKSESSIKILLANLNREVEAAMDRILKNVGGH